MSSSLDAFRQQRELLMALHEDAKQLNAAVASIRADLDALARHDALRDTLHHQQRWLQRAEAAMKTAQDWQRASARTLWPHLALRWLALALFALTAVVLSTATYAWATRPYADEVALLRARLMFVEQMERRMFQMSPAERRQFDTLLRGTGPK